jgi:hypothetical protein
MTVNRYMLDSEAHGIICKHSLLVQTKVGCEIGGLCQER